VLSKRIANITPSATHVMTARIAEKRAAGENNRLGMDRMEAALARLK
jgi:hypothetical protein